MEAPFFDIVWITKTFTTLVLADMMTQGIVNLHDSIEIYLPKQETVPQYHGTKITLENLATHTSGLPFMPSNTGANNTIGDLIQIIIQPECKKRCPKLH